MARNATTFGPGNLAAVKHGARSARLMRSKQQNIRSRVRRELKGSARAWLDRMILALEARVAAYHEYLDRVGGPIDSRGATRKCLDHCQKDEAALIRLYDRREGRPAESDDPLAILIRERLRKVQE